MESLVKAFYHIKMAEEYFADVGRTVQKASILFNIVKGYERKCQYVQNDFRQNPAMAGIDLTVLKNELNGDILFHEEISTLCLRLQEQQKDSLVKLIKCLLTGETINVTIQ